MKGYVPHGKRFLPRIPREELLELTAQELKNKGVENYTRSVLLKNISIETWVQKKPIFKQLQAKPISRDTEAWSRAFSLVLNYLHEFQMNNTIYTIELELRNSRKPKHNVAVDDDDAFQQIIQYIPKEKVPFADRVYAYKKENDKNVPKEVYVKPSMSDLRNSLLSDSSSKQVKKTVPPPKPNKQPAKIVEEVPNDFDSFTTSFISEDVSINNEQPQKEAANKDDSLEIIEEPSSQKINDFDSDGVFDIEENQSQEKQNSSTDIEDDVESENVKQDNSFDSITVESEKSSDSFIEIDFDEDE